MPALAKQALDEFLVRHELTNNIQEAADEPFSVESLESISPQATELQELAKVPDIVFYDNALQLRILKNMQRDFDLGEHLLLIGNQGTGKNKLTDKFLMQSGRAREYVQLHRDTTVSD